jgi:hypothetical protein
LTLLFSMMRYFVPGSMKRGGLLRLFELTADAFQCEMPELRGLSFDDCLERYAVFTKDQAEAYLRSGQPIEVVKSRLYRNSREFGQALRKSFQIESWGAAVRALEGMYAAIGIDLRSDAQGGVTVSRCFFSKYYTGEVCELICSLDEGLAAGLSDGGELCFVERITGGNGSCRGTLSKGQ